MNARIPALLAAAALAACGYKPVEANPSKQPKYEFPHSTHVDADVPCSACHDVAKATKLDPDVRHVRLPANPSKTDPCSNCHDTNPKPPPTRPPEEYRLVFSHADHLPRVKGDCKACHQKLPETGDAAAPVPPMGACTACHVHQQMFADAQCTRCHTDLKSYKPETAFRHEGQWLRTHGQLAKPSAETCAACHDQTYCAACHSPATAATRIEVQFPERVGASYIHRGDYVGRHTVEAQAKPQDCRRCHGSGFCDACHAANGFSPSAIGNIVRPVSHGSGWVGGPNRHGQEARRDVSACAACHDQQGPKNTCVGCHAVSASTGTGINPHPASFLGNHSLGDVSKNSMCRACHTR